ncbi:MAG: hypothetical protein N2116_03680, partial [Armatimonadetes bacterium]|nr:hypothetical protein [Armatimonadota bacterium]
MDADWIVKRPLAVVSGAFVAGTLAEAGLPEVGTVLVAAFVLTAFSLSLAILFKSYRLFWATVSAF